MGYGTWTKRDFMEYSRRMNRTVGADGRIRGDYSNKIRLSAAGEQFFLRCPDKAAYAPEKRSSLP